MRKNIGFTLIEMTIVIVLIGIIAGLGTTLLSAAFNSGYAQIGQTSVDNEAKLALARMARDLRAISSASTITATSNTLSFTTTNSSTVDYSLSGTNLLDNGNVLARHVSNLSFVYLDENGTVVTNLANTDDIKYIDVSFSISNNHASMPYSLTIYPRNL